jgi:hypothetical protein
MVGPVAVAGVAGEALVAEPVRERRNVCCTRRGRADALWRQRLQIMVMSFGLWNSDATEELWFGLLG